MRGRWWTSLVLMVAWIAVGCGESERCAIDGDDVQTTIRCPGEKAVTTDGDVEGPCRRRGERIVCEDGTTLAFEDTDANEQGPRGPEGPGVQDEGSEFAAGAPGLRRSGCERVGGEAICADGRRATIPEGVSEGASCTSEMVAGVGRRIVCGDERVRPDGESDVDVRCEYRGEEDAAAIVCTDGTVVETGVGPCEPSIERKGDSVVRVECGPESYEMSLDGCERDWTIKTRADLEELQQAECSHIYGDVFVEPLHCETGETVDGRTSVTCGQEEMEVRGEVAGPCWRSDTRLECAAGGAWELGEVAAEESLWELPDFGSVDYIGGSLFIEDQPNLRSVELNELVGIGGSVVIRKNRRLEHLGGFEQLRWVTRSWTLSQNEGLRSWHPPEKLTLIDESLLLSGNRELEGVGTVEDGGTDWWMPGTLDVGGAAVVTDNDAMGWCMSSALGAWLGDKAGAQRVYVGGYGAEQGCPEVNWGRRTP